MKDEEKLAAINETNKEIFELTEKALKDNPVFSYENEKTGEIDDFIFKPELSLEIKNKKGDNKSKFYVFENENSLLFLKKGANEIQRDCSQYPSFTGIIRLATGGVNSDMGAAHSNFDTSTESGGGNVAIKSSQSNLTTKDIFKLNITQTVDFSNVSEFHLPYISKLVDKSTSNFSTLFSESRPLVVSFDTEYTHVSDDRYTLTAMYSFKLFSREFIVLQVLNESEQLKMQDFKHFTKLIMRILKTSFDLKKFPLRYSTPVRDNDNNNIVGENVKKGCEGRRLHIELICHFGRTDLSFFKILSGITYKRKNDLKLKFEDHNFSMLSICRAAGAGGVFSMKKHGNYTIKVDRSNGWNRYAMFNVTIRDTMNFTNANNLSLASLGQSLGLPKMDMSKAEYECMHSTFRKDTYKFIKYSLADALITQRYFNQILGENIMLPPTYNGLNAECFKAKQIQMLFKHYNFETRKFNFDYDEFFRGIEKITDGLDYNQDTNRFTPIQSYRILNNDPWFAAFSFQMCESYFGGNNQCVQGYWIDKKTIDIDLKSAYPTSECCIYDIDYQKPGFTHETERAIESFTNLLMMNPFLPCVVCLKSFKFPDTVKYPCITQKVDGNIVYTREKTGDEYIYINGIEYWAALKMGCKMHVISILQANILLDDNKNMVKTLGLVNSHLISKRKELAEKFGKKSKQALDYKLAANGSYGKMAQGMNDSNSYNALVDRMESVGGGCITNPYYASYITAIARVILNLTSQEITDLGYSTYSNTTDGLITDLPEDMLSQLKIYGLKRILQENRALFFNEKPDSDIFEVKHRQDVFLNVATRHNIALQEGGVLAHGGIKTEYEKDSMADRLEMIRAFLECDSTGYDYKDSSSVSMRQIVMQGKKFHKEDLIKNHAMRYDFKRKPCHISDENIQFGGNVYTVARFDTVPYLNVEEFLKYRAAAKTYKLVRTASDFNDLILKTENNKREVGKRVYVKKNVNETKVTSLLRMYFQQLIDIQAFNNKTQSQIAEILNNLNYCTRKITINDIKNAKRKNRTSTLRIEDVQDLIDLLNVAEVVRHENENEYKTKLE